MLPGRRSRGNGTGGPGFEVVGALPSSYRYKLGDIAMAKTQNSAAGRIGLAILRDLGQRRDAAPARLGLLGHAAAPRVARDDRAHCRARDDGVPGRARLPAVAEGLDRDGAPRDVAVAMRCSRRLLLATALGAAAGVASATAGQASRGRPAVVFDKRRATAEPARSTLSHPAGRGATSRTQPVCRRGARHLAEGSRVRILEQPVGTWRLMLSADGKGFRSVTVARGAGPSDPVAPPLFAAGGAVALIPYSTPDSVSRPAGGTRRWSRCDPAP